MPHTQLLFEESCPTVTAHWTAAQQQWQQLVRRRANLQGGSELTGETGWGAHRPLAVVGSVNLGRLLPRLLRLASVRYFPSTRYSGSGSREVCERVGSRGPDCALPSDRGHGGPTRG
jgi:hypothetical protein